MIRCSTSNVMYLQSVSVLAASMGAFLLAGGSKGQETCTSECRDHDPSAIRRSKRSGNGDPDRSRKYFKDKEET